MSIYLLDPPRILNLSMDTNPKVIFWNVRGLNNRAKRAAVRTVIATAAPCIVCLQETKLSSVSPSHVSETLGGLFDGYYLLPADDTRGGILLAWQTSVIFLSNPTIGDHHVSATVCSNLGGPHWWITGVYGPQGDDAKIAFLDELQDFRSNISGPWLLGGDFNMITSAADKNKDRVTRRTMNRFRRFISDHGLHDIYLHGRRYTWSNEQANPTLVRIDRVLCTPSWEMAHSHCLLRCLSSAASDHCLLLVDCSSRSPGGRRFHFQRFWPSLDGFHQVVDEAWSSVPPDPDPFCRLFIRLKATAKHLQRWSSRVIQNIST